jgi:Fur family ferric uptake transcriptional regulator
MIRNTRQRQAIMAAFDAAGRPLTAGEVYELARSRAPRLGLRTVFRNIRELVDEGRLVGVDYPGQPVRYERVVDKAHKPHFICRLCHKVFDLPVDAPEVAVQAPPGLVIEGQETIFYGRCQDPDNCPNRKA